MPEPDMRLLVSDKRGRVLQAHNFSREEIRPGFKGRQIRPESALWRTFFWKSVRQNKEKSLVDKEAINE